MMTRTMRVALLSALAAVLGVGCDRGGQPPEPLALAEVPAAIEGAFTDAGAEAKQAAVAVAESVRTNGYRQAYVQLQALMERPELTQSQRSVGGRSLMALSDQLSAAAEGGDAGAQELLQFHRENK